MTCFYMRVTVAPNGLSNCRGQTYDGASNMMGKKSGISTTILAEQPKAVAIHCQGHSLIPSISEIDD